MTNIYLYTTLGCHLCEQAMELAQPIAEDMGAVILPVEIADSDDLMQRYGVRIPVLALEGIEQDLGWPFDAAQFSDWLCTNL
ncbi:MAG: glutaredoxin family protein [Pseudomonadales bacterium]